MALTHRAARCYRRRMWCLGLRLDPKEVAAAAAAAAEAEAEATATAATAVTATAAAAEATCARHRRHASLRSPWGRAPSGRARRFDAATTAIRARAPATQWSCHCRVRPLFACPCFWGGAPLWRVMSPPHLHLFAIAASSPRRAAARRAAARRVARRASPPRPRTRPRRRRRRHLRSHCAHCRHPAIASARRRAQASHGRHTSTAL